MVSLKFLRRHINITEAEISVHHLIPLSLEEETQICESINLEQKNIKEILHWYKDEFFLVKEINYNNNELTARIKFSDYPFIKGEMPFVSSNLINLAIDQCALIHIGMMIKYNYISVRIVNRDGLEKTMSFEEYNRIVGDEFVTAKLEGRYHKPIPPLQMVEILSRFLEIQKTSTGRYKFSFEMKGEHFFTIKPIFVYPLNLRFIGK